MTNTLQLGLLGNNIDRSRMKNLIELLGELNDLDVTYRLMDLAARPAPVSIAEELTRCRTEGFRGVNVTHPYKRDAFHHVTTMPHFPKGLTSVNTVLFDTDKNLADNTDYSGCVRAFRNQFGDAFKPGKVLMLGAGGVGVAIAYALQRLGVGELILHDKNQEPAEALVGRMQEAGFTARLAGADLIAEMTEIDGLINATPIGMFQYPGNPFPEAGFDAQRWAFDAVYTPENTEFLQQCRNRDIVTLSGFQLFLYQGLDAFHHFTGITVDAAVAKTEFLRRHPLEMAT
jgi:shikimate dehydrogenase